MTTAEHATLGRVREAGPRIAGWLGVYGGIFVIGGSGISIAAWFYYVGRAGIALPGAVILRGALVAILFVFIGSLAVGLGGSVLRGRWTWGRWLLMVGVVAILFSPLPFLAFPSLVACGGSLLGAGGAFLILLAGILMQAAVTSAH